MYISFYKVISEVVCECTGIHMSQMFFIVSWFLLTVFLQLFFFGLSTLFAAVQINFAVALKTLCCSAIVMSYYF